MSVISSPIVHIVFMDTKFWTGYPKYWPHQFERFSQSVEAITFSSEVLGTLFQYDYILPGQTTVWSGGGVDIDLPHYNQSQLELYLANWTSTGVLPGHMQPNYVRKYLMTQ